MKSVLIYTMHRSASMFLHKLTIDVANEFGIRYYSINDNKYYSKIREHSWKIFIEDKARQGCFGPIRAGATERIIPESLSEYAIVLHLRDPRDVLTSFFFSITYSHPKREGQFNPDDEMRKQWREKGIDNFVLHHLPVFKERYQLLTSSLLDNENVQLVRYEDMVSNFPEWLDKYLSAFSHLDVPPKRILGFISSPNSITKIHQRLADKYKNEFTPPQSEEIYRHKRQITPGNYKNKLKPDTIETLNHEFSHILEALSYK